ncbi:unnamed protein product [Peronospora effusa]|nr:unnamed protein product [Peronospora effusa]
MSQQAKDIYSGIKKIFPSSSRSGSLSRASRMSATSLDTAIRTEGHAIARDKATKTKESRSSFSFSGWKDKHRAPLEPTPPIVMSLPYGATAATPKANKSSEESDKGPRSSLTQTLNNALHSTPLRSSLFGKSSNKVTSTKSSRCPSVQSTGNTSSFSSTSFELPSQPPKLGTRCVSEERPFCMGNRTLRNSGVHGTMTTSSLSSGGGGIYRQGHKNQVCAVSHNLTSFSSMKTVSSSYQSSSSSLSNLTAPSNTVHSGSAILSPKKTRGKKERGMSLSFSSSRKAKKEMEEIERLDAKFSTEMRPHASTWDSDSDDDYEDTKRPTQGLGRRSNSMDFMEQAPTHLIAKIWRKLPIQARLIGGRGNVDLDLQKDRTSFSRSSEARKFALAAQKAKAAELHRRSLSSSKELSPVPVDEVLAPGVAKRTRFGSKPTIIASNANDGAPGAYTALESYDDVLVRVCKFAAHDQRPTTTKVQEFLERSMAFLHCTRTKHGNVVNISNGEIRMWRRLALHDWTLEEVTTTEAAAALGVKGKDVEAPRNNSVATESTDSDSDSQQSRGRRRLHSAILHRSLSASVVEEEPEMEGDEDEELEVPSNMKFAKLCDVINCCVNFGEVQFTPDEVNDLVRLEFIVEEDGWI